MAFCEKCGRKLDEGAKFCTGCGATTEPSQQTPPATNQNDFSAKLANLNNTADTTNQFDKADIEQNKVMGILAYLGILCFIPMFAAKESKFARFHTNQGLILLIAGAAWSIAYTILTKIILAISWRLYFITSIIGLTSLVFLVLCILGIVNVANGRAKELPVIGKFKILK